MCFLRADIRRLLAIGSGLGLGLGLGLRLGLGLGLGSPVYLSHAPLSSLAPLSCYCVIIAPSLSVF
jgi:hypothetical protein